MTNTKIQWQHCKPNLKNFIVNSPDGRWFIKQLEKGLYQLYQAQDNNMIYKTYTGKLNDCRFIADNTYF